MSTMHQLQKRGPDPFHVVMLFLAALAVCFLAAYGIARADPTVGTDHTHVKPAWGCQWFTYAPHDEWLSQKIDRRDNTAVFTYDTTKNGVVDTVHIYTIEGIGSAYGSMAVPVLHPTPTTVWYDVDNDTQPDLKLVDTTGDGACESFRSVAFKKQSEIPYIPPTHGKKEKT